MNGTSRKIVPKALPVEDDEQLAPDAWGFRDTAFNLLANGSVTLTGHRYALSGLELPSLLPWVSDVMSVNFRESAVPRKPFPPRIPASRATPEFIGALQEIVAPAQISLEAMVRLRHGHGHTVEEIFALRHDGLSRVPDVVVYPQSAEDVERLVAFAGEQNAVLVAFGGGTNVIDALRCSDNEARTIVSVDMRQMNRILWIDAENQTACIEAGAVGRYLATALAAHGFTMGHEPDSYEFSTLGGWIATHASGMKKNRYGNIEDILLDVQVVTTAGLVARTPVVPRDSIGADPRRWIMGSEGRFGIITQATVKIRPLPETEQHDAIVFKSFEEGVAFLHDLTRTGKIPASVRLVDNTQFQLSQTLKPGAAGIGALKRRAEKWFITRAKGFDPKTMVACTLLFEGRRDEVAAQQATVKQLAKKYGGISAGAENGAKGYQLTFGIAYLRDFVMGFGVLAESFETTVSWTDVLGLCARVKQRLLDEFARLGLPGRPFITARVTQLYDSGVCVYFYLGIHHGSAEHPTDVYGVLERAARDEILKCGGSLSHHHGVGKLRREFLPRVLSPAARAWSDGIKHAVDPQHLFGVIDS
ncbi:MAG: FAD-binding oxidoreductase [Gemmatimonadota bacterium]|nr:FAD-binding oxidoreductase [Gemmatimonadota bacterium]